MRVATADRWIRLALLCTRCTTVVGPVWLCFSGLAGHVVENALAMYITFGSAVLVQSGSPATQKFAPAILQPPIFAALHHPPVLLVPVRPSLRPGHAACRLIALSRFSLAQHSRDLRLPTT
ncbi:uncharacterized protein J3D65DRAFT_226423 [Phyllosticta citribraziliensis]|uniref:Secreted protein n=1 Tax=Phyllosticta citribraziliensis TaxID=989973 RepID=A0ABR1M528_9PEZI